MIKNVQKYHHPNKNNDNYTYIVNRVYYDNKNSFDDKVYDWNFHPFDRLKVKKIKNNKWK